MKKQLILVLAVLIFTGGIFAGGRAERMPPSSGMEEGERISLELVPGPAYSREINKILFKYTVWPQVAVWIESADGTFLKTLYITRLTAEQDYIAAPKEGRPEALPVWSHLQEPNRLDAVTSATSTENSVEYGTGTAGLAPGRYIVKLETNRSYDWNETYTKKNSGVNGQPSLIYQAELTIGEKPQTASLELVGRGAVDGSHGEILTDLEGIDTALDLFSGLFVSYYRE